MRRVKSKQITVAVKKWGRAPQHQSGREGTISFPNFSLHPSREMMCLCTFLLVGSGFRDMSCLWSCAMVVLFSWYQQSSIKKKKDWPPCPCEEAACHWLSEVLMWAALFSDDEVTTNWLKMRSDQFPTLFTLSWWLPCSRLLSATNTVTDGPR